MDATPPAALAAVAAAAELGVAGGWSRLQKGVSRPREAEAAEPAEAAEAAEAAEPATAAEPMVLQGQPSAHVRSAVPAPESLHPALWLGHQLGRHVDQAVPSGFVALDKQLPGGGWPKRVLTELLLAHPGVGEIRLLAPSLAAAQRNGRQVMLFDPPAQLSAPALMRLGIDVAQLLIINTRTRVIPGADSLWALEQALKSGHVGAVVAWLPPRLRAERLRRLQLAAQAHDGPAFVMREVEASQRPTAAPLRLLLRAAGGDGMLLSVLKRRGPPLETPVHLDLPAVLSATATRRVRNVAPRPAQVVAESLPAATFINLEPSCP